MALEQLLMPKDVGEIIRLKKSAINRLLATGQIPSLLVTDGQKRRAFRVRPSDLEKWLNARRISG